MPHSTTDSSAMSRPSSTSTSTNSASAFPKPAGVSVEIAENLKLGEQLSPSRSTFSFEPDDSTKAPSPRDSVTRAVSYDVPEVPAGQRTRPCSSRARTQYYEDQFAYKTNSTGSIRDRISKDSPIIAELRTNVIIKDEYTLVTDLSNQLSTRYQRPDSSIMITVDHSACILLGGSFEPCYILTISALPTQVQPITNKRNAALIQQFMVESLGVPVDRGVIKFIAIPEENLATSGMTVLGEIERAEKQQAEELGSSLKRGLTKSSRKSGVTKAKSSFQLSRNNSKATGRAVITPPPPSPRPPEQKGEKVEEKTAPTDLEQTNSTPPIDKPGRNASVKCKTSKALDTEKSAVKATTKLVPPPIPEDAPTPKIGKRKSFVAIFRR